ncbi:MAG TPA: translocation/assembly module TamB domain-containing protein [Casimicrobiaceae bacterium]|jgi:translocation and assembly module TamB|nr:translocation/assembly module TamB domain-containing protein [Casimicrobiaceae bacterium]
MAARRGAIVIFAGLAALALLTGLLIGGAAWFLSSESGLRWVVEEVRSRTGEKLKLEGTAGSLAGTMRIARLTYTDKDLGFVAENVEFTWSPRALFSRSVVIDSLSASQVTLDIKAGDKVNSPPVSLALPWSIDVRRAFIERLDVASGSNRWRFARLAFRYAGGDKRHALDELAFHSEWGDLSGNLAIDAAPPFVTTGIVSFLASDALKRAKAALSIAGDLTTLVLSGEVSAIGAHAGGTARISPFDERWLRGFALSAADVDLALFDARIPKTALSITAEGASSERGQVRGKLTARNAEAGTVDSKRLPIQALSSSFEFDAGTATLEALEATLGSSGRVAGNVRVGGDEARWNLSVRDLDLRSIASSLNATRLAGTLKGQLRLDTESPEGMVAGELKQAAVALAFDTTVRRGVIDVRKFRAQAHGGSLEGTATFATNGAQAFSASARATALDPAAFGKFPPASISGTIDARGELKPTWVAALKLKIGDGSRLRGLPLSGAGALTVESERIHDADVDIAAGGNRLRLSGSFGRSGDSLAFTLDARDFAAIDSRLGGRLYATGHVAGAWARPAVQFSASGDSLRFGAGFSAATLSADVDIGSAASSTSVDRPLKLRVAVGSAHADALVVRSASADLAGTVGRHDATLTLATGAAGDAAAAAVDVTARLSGGWSGDASSGSWSGNIVALDNRGAYRLSLAQPASLEAGIARVHLAGALGTLEGGRFAIEELKWEDGRWSSRGDFSRLPVAPLLAFSAADARIASTLILSGRWAFSATPRVTGTLSVSRDDGDLAPIDAPELALGLTRLDLAAVSTDDRVHATLTARSRLGDADLAADLGASPRGAGRFDSSAPLSLKAHLDSASLRALQTLTRTNAVVEGRLKLDVTGHGTLEHVQLSGIVEGDELKIEAPQYGVYVKDGRLRARLSDDNVTVSELSFTAGEGRFLASGTMPAIVGSSAAAGAISWSAEKFALFNRPDTQLTLSGAGTLALKNKTVTLAGAIKAERGYFELPPTRPDALGDDVVIRGRERKRTDAAAQRIPFAVDVELDFGEHLTFVGQGFNSGLEGKLHVRTTANRELIANGTINAVRGTYTAFGQRLAIERGKLYFDGPLDNPGLDVLALRKNQPVEAGVEVTGTVQVPLVRLTSNPPVQDNEKLAWLVLGHGLNSTTGAESVALQAALAALAGSGSEQIGQRVAKGFGLDDISFRGASTARPGTTAAQVVAVSKRLTDKLSLIYEQGLSLANNSLRIEYVLSRTVTLRAEAGLVNGFGIYYSRSYD